MALDGLWTTGVFEFGLSTQRNKLIYRQKEKAPDADGTATGSFS
jgi:hypothetical protein